MLCERKKEENNAKATFTAKNAKFEAHMETCADLNELMTCVGSLVRYACVLSYSTARLSCPFLEARGNLEDASTTLSAHSRV